MDRLIDEYIRDHEYAWAESTRKSERARLRSLSLDRRDGRKNPEEVWRSLEHLNAYSRTQAWNRLCHYTDWCIEMGHRQGPNEFKQWRAKNARQFKHVYERRVPEVSYDEVKRLIEGIEDRAVREKCIELLAGALRWVDSARRDGDFTRGKGNKPRRVYGPKAERPVSYSRCYRELRRLGLSPHGLRKVRLNYLAKEKKADVFTLMEIAGWSEPKTALSYIKAANSEVEKLMQD